MKSSDFFKAYIFFATQKFLFLLLLTCIHLPSKVFSQATPLSFTAIPFTQADLNAPGRGVEQWHNANDVNVPVEGTNTQRLDVYFRFVWTKIEGPTMGSYNWFYFDSLVNVAIQKRQKFSFGIMTLYPEGRTEQGLVFYDGGYASYPLYLHTLMQSETVKDWKTGTTWTPNYNSVHYQDRLFALHQALNAHIESASFNGVRYKDVIGYIDIRGYGAWGEWHSGYTVNNVVSDYPAGTFPTVATLKKIVDAHTQGFPDFPLVAMISAFDAQLLHNTWNPPEIAHYVLTQRNNWGLIGWRRDQWGATDSYIASYLENNTRTYAGLVFKDSIMVRWKSAPVTGEPPGWTPSNFSDLERQIRLYHATSFGNGNYGGSPTKTIKDRVRASSKACGYRLIIENGEVNVSGNNITIRLNWKNTGLAPTYENWNVEFELKNSSNLTAWTGVSQFKPRLFLPPTPPSTVATPITDNFSLPAGIPAGTYKLNLIIRDPNAYRAPLPLAINGVNADGSYTLTQLTIQTVPAPIISVVNNCGNSILTASGYTGTLLWSTGETTPSVTVTAEGQYYVTQTVNGITSVAGTATASPKIIPPAPVVTVDNNCGHSLLTTSGSAGSLLWNTGESSTSITVYTEGTYTVVQTMNGCTSAAGSGRAEPLISLVVAPTVTVVNNCDDAVLTASGYSGPLLWSNGATTGSITVTNAGAYAVHQTVDGCISPAGTGIAAPLYASIPAPAIAVDNNCGNSTLTASGHIGSLLWSNGETTPFITVNDAGTYAVSQIIGGCAGITGTAVAAPKPVPVLSGGLLATAISGTAFSYTPTSNTANTSFAWRRATVTGISNAASNGTGPVNETLINTTGLPVNVIYEYTLTANQCSNTQYLVVTVNPPVAINCVINGTISSSFNSTPIPAGRYIWFNSSFNPGSLGSGTTPVTINVSNAVITFTANNQSYSLNVPDARIRFDAGVSSASTQFIDNIWQTVVPYNYTNYIFMTGLAYQVPVNLPGKISNVRWTATLRIDKANISVGWRWAAAVYTSFASHAGLSIKPISSNTQNPYLNSDDAGTPENFKSYLVAGARGNGGSNYTGNYSTTTTSTCSVGTAQRSAASPATMQSTLGKQDPVFEKEKLYKEMLDADLMPNPVNTSFHLSIRGNHHYKVTVRVINTLGQVIEKIEHVTTNTVLQLGYKWPGGSYFIELTQPGQRKIIKLIKAN